jgi:hypothetical protein
MSAPQQNEAEKNIEIWKVKKLIKRLEAACVPPSPSSSPKPQLTSKLAAATAPA